MNHSNREAKEELIYNIGAVSRLTGLAVSLIHAWERRYGFPASSGRTPGGHRLYSPLDVERLRKIKVQIDQGLSTHQAVLFVQNNEIQNNLDVETPYKNLTSENSPFLPELLSERVVNALLRPDLGLASRLLGEMLAFYSPEELTLNVIGPALQAIGEGWKAGQVSIAGEHLATNFLRQRLHMWMESAPPGPMINPVLLACAPGEWHEGSLLMLGVLLRRQGWPVEYLGQNVPLEALGSFVDQVNPRAVVLVAMQLETAQSLQNWPQWIHLKDGKSQVCYGGRAFLVDPGLKANLLGLYLGDSLLEGLNRLVGILVLGIGKENLPTVFVFVE